MEVTGASSPAHMDMGPAARSPTEAEQKANEGIKDEVGMITGAGNNASTPLASEPADAGPAPELQDEQAALKQEPAPPTSHNESQSTASQPRPAGAEAEAAGAGTGQTHVQGPSMQEPSAASERPQAEPQPQPTQQAEALSFEQVYEQIMRQKREANAQSTQGTQQTGQAVAMQPQRNSQDTVAAAPGEILPQVVVRAPSYVVLPDGSLALTAGAWNAMQPAQGQQPASQGQQLGQLAVPRTNTLDNVLNSFLGGGGSLDIGLFAWGSLAPEKFMEGLASDMKEIAAQPPDAQAMRNTFNIERIVSGGEGDLQALVKEAAGQPHQAITLAGGAGVTTALMEAQAQQGGPQQQQMASHSGTAATQPAPSKPSQSGGTSLSAPAAGTDMSHAVSNGQLQSGQLQQLVQQGTASHTSMGPSANGLLGPQDGCAAPHLLQQEVALWERGNQQLQQQLDMLLDQVDSVQQENHRMKLQLLDTCARNGIQADMLQLNSTIASHRPSAMPDSTATCIAAAALGDNGGDVTATIHQLLMTALQKNAGAVNGSAGADAALAQPVGMSVKLPVAQLMDLQGGGFPIQQLDNVKIDLTAGAAGQSALGAQQVQRGGAVQGWPQQQGGSMLQEQSERGPGKPPPQQQPHMQHPQQQHSSHQMMQWPQAQHQIQLQTGPQGQQVVSGVQGLSGQQVLSLLQPSQLQGLQPGMHPQQYTVVSQQQQQQPGGVAASGDPSQRAQGVQLLAGGLQAHQVVAQGSLGGGQLQVAPLTVQIPQQALSGNAVLLNGQGMQVIARNPSQGTHQILGMLSDGARVFQSGSMDLSALLASVAGTPTQAPGSALATVAASRPAQQMFFG